MSEQRPRRSQQQRRAESEQRILRAAATVVAAKGLREATLVEIAQEAGCSHALITHMFGSKLALIEGLKRVVDEHFVSRTMAAMDGLTGMAALGALVDVYLSETTGEDPVGRVHLVLWAEAIVDAPEIRAARAAWDGYFRAGIAQAIRGSTAVANSPVDVEMAALVIVGALRGVALQLVLDPAAASLADASSAIVHVARALLPD